MVGELKLRTVSTVQFAAKSDKLKPKCSAKKSINTSYHLFCVSFLQFNLLLTIFQKEDYSNTLFIKNHT